jgi:hypothetical protein
LRTSRLFNFAKLAIMQRRRGAPVTPTDRPVGVVPHQQVAPARGKLEQGAAAVGQRAESAK